MEKRDVLWDDLENIVVAEVGLNGIFNAEAFNVVGSKRRWLFLDIHGRSSFHYFLCFLFLSVAAPVEEEEEHHVLDIGEGFRAWIGCDEVQLRHFLVPNPLTYYCFPQYYLHTTFFPSIFLFFNNRNKYINFNILFPFTIRGLDEMTRISHNLTRDLIEFYCLRGLTDSKRLVPVLAQGYPLGEKKTLSLYFLNY